MKKILYSCIVSLVFIACGGTTHQLASGKLDKAGTFKANSYYGCCGLFAYYFNIYHNKILTSQVVYIYAGNPDFMPTKFVFRYNKANELVSCDRYIATVNDDLAFPISNEEQAIFVLLSSKAGTGTGVAVMPFRDIKGFRKPKPGEHTHPFPLLKRGYKIKLS